MKTFKEYLKEINRLEKETSVLSEISKEAMTKYVRHATKDASNLEKEEDKIDKARGSLRQAEADLHSHMSPDERKQLDSMHSSLIKKQNKLRDKRYQRGEGVTKALRKLSKNYYEVTGTKEGKEMKVSIPAKSRDEAMQLAHQKGLTNIKLHKKEE